MSENLECRKTQSNYGLFSKVQFIELNENFMLNVRSYTNYFVVETFSWELLGPISEKHKLFPIMGPNTSPDWLWTKKRMLLQYCNCLF